MRIAKAEYPRVTSTRRGFERFGSVAAAELSGVEDSSKLPTSIVAEEGTSGVPGMRGKGGRRERRDKGSRSVTLGGGADGASDVESGGRMSTFSWLPGAKSMRGGDGSVRSSKLGNVSTGPGGGAVSRPADVNGVKSVLNCGAGNIAPQKLSFFEKYEDVTLMFRRVLVLRQGSQRHSGRVDYRPILEPHARSTLLPARCAAAISSDSPR